MTTEKKTSLLDDQKKWLKAFDTSIRELFGGASAMEGLARALPVIGDAVGSNVVAFYCLTQLDQEDGCSCVLAQNAQQEWYTVEPSCALNLRKSVQSVKRLKKLNQGASLPIALEVSDATVDAFLFPIGHIGGTRCVFVFGNTGDNQPVIDKLKLMPFLMAAATYVFKEGAESQLLVQAEELKRRETEIQAHQLLNQDIMHTIPDFVFVVDYPDANILFSNLKQEEILGYSLRGVTNLLHFFSDKIHPEDMATVVADLFARLLKAADGEVVSCDFRVRAANGEMLWVTKRAKIMNRHPDGSINQYLILLQNITPQKTAQERLEQSQARYQNFVQYSTEGISYINCGQPIPINISPEDQVRMFYDNAFIEESNMAIARTYGLEDPALLIGQKVKAFHEGEHFEENARTFHEFAKNNYRLEHFETKEPASDGNVLYILNNSFGVIEDGCLVGVWGTQSDITLQKKAAQLLVESEALFRSLYERGPLGIAYSDYKFNIFRANERFCEMLGYEKEGLAGKNFSEIAYPENLELDREYFRAIVAARQPFTHMQKRYLHKNGKPVWANISISFVYNDIGRMEYAIIFFEDISDKMYALEALKESEAVQRAILEALPDLKFRVDKHGTYIGYYPSSSDETELLVPVENFMNKNIDEIAMPYAAAMLKDNLSKAMSTGKVQTYEYVTLVENQRRYHEVRISPIDEKEAIIVIRNISELKKAQNTLQEKVHELDRKNRQLQQYIDSNMQLENFAYVASHDMREPLRTISSFAQLLHDRCISQLDEQAQTYLRFIFAGAKNLNDLIEDLLAYAKVNTEEYEIEEVNITQLIDNVVQDLTSAMTTSQASIEIGDMPQTIKANRTKIQQLFLNLINNAIKFRKQDTPPTIRINCADQGAVWHFSISDDGIGVCKLHQSTIFLIFKKLHSSRDYEGTGMGLTICKKIVEQHKGNIWVESELNQGATFYFTIRKDLDKLSR